MKCESCQTEFTGEACPNCGLKPHKQRCKSCSKKFYSSYLKGGFCPDCFGMLKDVPYKSPLLAFVFSIIPGAGHVYLGMKERGAGCFLLFCISFLTLIGWIFIILFSGIDAYILANQMNRLDGYE